MRHLLAGISAGVAGAIFVILFLMLSCMWNHRSVWVVANLFSTALYGWDAYQNRFTFRSVGGVAIVLVMYGIAGAFWGVMWRDQRPRFRWFWGALCGAITYFVLFRLFWKRLDPVLWLYAPERPLQFATVIWGMISARSPVIAARLEEKPWAVQNEEPAEVRSGEVIL